MKIKKYKFREFIHVSRKHIDEGHAGCVISCPIALAILYAGHYGVKVHYSIEFDGGKCTSLPKSCYRFISKFDAGKKVKTFNFYLKYN